MQNTRPFAIVVTHSNGRGRALNMPWLETDFHIATSEWIVLSDEGWHAVAEGDATIWDALERKLLIGFYITRPQLIAVIGRSSARKALSTNVSNEEKARQIVRRIRSLLLPTRVLGFWTDESGSLVEILNPSECTKRKQFDFAKEHESAA